MWIKCQDEQTWINIDHMPIASIAKQGPVAPAEGEAPAEPIEPPPEKFYILFRNANINAIYARYDTFEEAEKEFSKLMKKIA